MVGGDRELAFALVCDDLKKLYPTLARLFTDPWVASYQIGFGPPLVRANESLIRRVKASKSALEKLEAYLDCCFLDENERARLAGTFRRLVVRKEGAVEAESLDEKSADALDLSLRLHRPSDAAPAVQEDMARHGMSTSVYPVPVPPEALTGRFRIKLGDPRNDRLFHVEAVRTLANPDAVERALAIELRIPAAAHQPFAAFLSRHEVAGAFKVADIGEPVSHAKHKTNGKQR